MSMIPCTVRGERSSEYTIDQHIVTARDQALLYLTRALPAPAQNWWITTGTKYDFKRSSYLDIYKVYWFSYYSHSNGRAWPAKAQLPTVATRVNPYNGVNNCKKRERAHMVHGEAECRPLNKTIIVSLKVAEYIKNPSAQQARHENHMFRCKKRPDPSDVTTTIGLDGPARQLYPRLRGRGVYSL